MQKVKIILNANIGYAGSSEDPAKTSARLTGIIVMVITKATALAALAGYALPFTDTSTQLVGASFGFIGGFVLWSTGLVRYVVNALKA